MKIGSKIRVPVNGGVHEAVHAIGTIVYVHPAGRFVVVEFDYSSAGRFYGERWSRKFRESYHLVPPRERLCSSMEIPHFRPGGVPPGGAILLPGRGHPDATDD